MKKLYSNCLYIYYDCYDPSLLLMISIATQWWYDATEHPKCCLNFTLHSVSLITISIIRYHHLHHGYLYGFPTRKQVQTSSTSRERRYLVFKSKHITLLRYAPVFPVRIKITHGVAGRPSGDGDDLVASSYQTRRIQSMGLAKRSFGVGDKERKRTVVRYSCPLVSWFDFRFIRPTTCKNGWPNLHTKWRERSRDRH